MMNKRDISVPVEEIIEKSFRTAVLLLVMPLIIYAVIWGPIALIRGTLNGVVLLLAIPVTVIFIVLHELTHAIGWKFASGLPWSAFTFGIHRPTFSPYCHTDSPMRARAYRFGAILPTIITGLPPLFHGLISGDAAWTLLGAFMLSSAIGDFYVLLIIRDLPHDVLVIDHPDNAGCFVLEDAV